MRLGFVFVCYMGKRPAIKSKNKVLFFRIFAPPPTTCWEMKDCVGEISSKRMKETLTDISTLCVCVFYVVRYCGVGTRLGKEDSRPVRSLSFLFILFKRRRRRRGRIERHSRRELRRTKVVVVVADGLTFPLSLSPSSSFFFS